MTPLLSILTSAAQARLCPYFPDVFGCIRGIQTHWASLANTLWPAYFNAEVGVGPSPRPPPPPGRLDMWSSLLEP